MSTQNITLVKKLFEEVYNNGNTAALDQFISPDVKVFDSALPQGKANFTTFKQVEKQYATAFPKNTVKIDDIFTADNDRVVVRWTAQGTQKGDLPGLPSSGKPFSKVTGVDIYSCKNNKITEIHQCWDRLSLLEQLGAIEEHVAALHG